MQHQEYTYQDQKLECDWSTIREKQVESKKSSSIYKINKSKYLGRGAFGIVYKGLRKSGRHFEEVAIKQFKLSQKWKSEEDWDKELVFFKRYGDKWDHKYLVKYIEILYVDEVHRWWLIFELFKGGTLLDQLNVIKQDKIERMIEFAKSFAKILYYLHYQMFKGYQSSKKDSNINEKHAKIGFIHRDVKPSNILFVNQKIKKDSKLNFKLADYGISIINYTDLQSKKSIAGTNIYKAPQIFENKEYSAKVDVWGYGATMFQLLSGGDRLFTGGAIKMNQPKKIKYIKQRLIWLRIKLRYDAQKEKVQNMKESKLKMIEYWIQILFNCLNYDSNKRWNSEQLCNYLATLQIPKQKKDQNFLKSSQQQELLTKKKIIFEINFETTKINYLQNRVFSIFEYVSSSDNRINRATLYILLKFVSNYIMDHGSKLKEKAKAIMSQKYTYYKNLIEEKKFSQLRYTCTQKIKNELGGNTADQYLDYYVKSKDPDLIESIPEVIAGEIRDSRRLLYEFIYLRQDQILQDSTFATMVSGIASVLDDFDEYSQVQFTDQDFIKNDVQFVSMKKHYNFFKIIKRSQNIDNCKNVFRTFKMNRQIPSNFQKKIVQFDLPIKLKNQ